MPTSTDVTNLKINTLTEAQYDTAVQGGVIGANELSIITDLDDAIQVTTLPTASASEEGKIYQFIGTTTGSYTNGYFYKCVSDGQNPATYSWTQVNVQPQGDSLPSQSGQSGKFLTTNGTNASWAIINALTNNTTQSYSLAILGNAYNSDSVAVGDGSTAYYAETIVIGSSCSAYSAGGIAIGYSAGTFAENANRFIAIGHQASVGSGAKGAIQIGSGTNSTAGTMAIGLTTDGSTYTNYELLSADGTIPAARIPYVPKPITSSSASGYAANTIVQYVGTTDATCTNGYFYKAGIIPSSATISQTTGSGLTDIAVVASTFESQISTSGSYNFTYIGIGWTNPDGYVIYLTDYGISYTGTPTDGDVLTVVYVGESNSWTRIDVQPSPVIPDPLPSQTGHSGEFLTTDGTDASWTTINALQNNASWVAIEISKYSSGITDNGGIAIGGEYPAAKNLSVAIGSHATANGQYNSSGEQSIAIGDYADADANFAIQLGHGSNTTDNTFKVGQYINSSWVNYELLSAGGTIPTDRFTTTPVADGTYVPTLTISSGTATRSWATPASGGGAPTITWYTVSTAGSTLTIADTSSAQLVKIYKNGLLLEPTADYSISGTTLTMVTALVVGDKITTEVF